MNLRVLLSSYKDKLSIKKDRIVIMDLFSFKDIEKEDEVIKYVEKLYIFAEKKLNIPRYTDSEQLKAEQSLLIACVFYVLENAQMEKNLSSIIEFFKIECESHYYIGKCFIDMYRNDTNSKAMRYYHCFMDYIIKCRELEIKYFINVSMILSNIVEKGSENNVLTVRK